MKWIKRLLLVVAMLLLGAIVLVAVAVHYLNGTPAYYRDYAWSAQERARLNQEAVDKLIAARNMAAAAWSAEVRADRAGPGNAAAPAQPPDEPAMHLTLTEEQLNAFLLHNFAGELSGVMTRPGLFLKQDRIILAGQLKDIGFGYLVSAYFHPAITVDGRLQLQLEKVLGGRLPLPQPLVDMQTDRARGMLQRKMPGWTHAAAMDSHGACNTAFVEAALGRLLLACFDGMPADAVVFMPGEKGKALPLKLTAIQVADGQLTLGVQAMDKVQRQKLADSVLGHNVPGK